tara:strand:- start:544 stop:1089 length:546 start_codon:yes stop_codon:yes gene_type:complete
MKKIIVFFLLIIMQSCSKNKTVLICGDHICVNKTEAKQYFEENLSLEVQVVDKINKEKLSLVELNMSDNSNDREISLIKKNNTKKELKLLTGKEIKEIKKKIKDKNNIKNKKTKQKITKKIDIKDKNTKKITKDLQVIKSNPEGKIIDICTILEKCSIDEISKFLIKEGKKKKFPDLTHKE